MPDHLIRPKSAFRAPTRRELLGALALLPFAGLAGCTSANATGGDDLAALLAANLDASGGDAAVRAVANLWRRRTPQMFTLIAPPESVIVVLLDESGKLLYAEGSDGDTAWEDVADGKGRLAVSGRPAAALHNTMQRPWNLMPLAHAASRGHQIELAGEETVDGVLFDRVRLTIGDGTGDGRSTEYFIGRASRLVERARDVRRLHAYEEEAQPLESVWSDFRNVGGIILPFVEVERNYKTGEVVAGGEALLDARVNIPVAEGTFGLSGNYDSVLVPASTAL